MAPSDPARTAASPGRRAPVDGRRTRWDTHRAERRQQVVEAALAVLAVVGPEFGLDQVADRAGITKPVIYRHFTDRAGLVQAMGERATGVLLDEWVLPVIATELPPRARVRAAISAYLGFLDENPNIYWLFVRHGGDSDVAQTNKEIIAAAVGTLTGEILTAAGGRERTATIGAHGLVGFVQNAAEWWLQHRSVDRDVLTDELTFLVWSLIVGVLHGYGVHVDPDLPLAPENLRREH